MVPPLMTYGPTVRMGGSTASLYKAALMWSSRSRRSNNPLISHGIRPIGVAYCRVSTLEQKRRGYGIDIQVREMCAPVPNGKGSWLRASTETKRRAGLRRTESSSGACSATVVPAASVQ